MKGINDANLSSNGVLLVFDITNRESFNNVSSWYNEVKEKVTEDC